MAPNSNEDQCVLLDDSEISFWFAHSLTVPSTCHSTRPKENHDGRDSQFESVQHLAKRFDVFVEVHISGSAIGKVVFLTFLSSTSKKASFETKSARAHRITKEKKV